MRRLAYALALAGGLAVLAGAAELGPIIIGVHFIPGVEAREQGRPWDVSFSFGLGISFDDVHSIELQAVTDSHVTSLGLWGQYQGRVTDQIAVGAGGTILWSIANRERVLMPVIETYARAEFTWAPGPAVSGSAGVSFPILTLAETVDGWELLPLAELPSLSLGGDAKIAEDTRLQGRITFQPIMMDTTVLTRPIGRISDQLLVLPAASTGIRYMP